MRPTSQNVHVYYHALTVHTLSRSPLYNSVHAHIETPVLPYTQLYSHANTPHITFTITPALHPLNSHPPHPHLTSLLCKTLTFHTTTPFNSTPPTPYSHVTSLPRYLLSSSSGFIWMRRASKMHCPSKNPDGSTRANSTEGEISDSLTQAMMSLISSLLWWLWSIQRVIAWKISSSRTYRESMARTHSFGRGRKKGPVRTSLAWWSTNWRHFSFRRETLCTEVCRRMGEDGVQVDVLTELMAEGFLEHPHHVGVR